MTETAPSDSPSHLLQPAVQLTALSRLASALAVSSYILVCWTLVSREQSVIHSGWLEAALLVSAAVATMCSLTRQLPAQNVLLAAAIIGSLGGIAHGLGALTGIPFGGFHFADDAGPRLFGVLAWPLPFLWIIAVVNSRGVARLILRPWKELRAYGFWLIGVTAALTVLFALALDPFASQVKHYWHWQPTKFPLTWQGAPLVTFLGWFITALLILAFATPALINKQPRPGNAPPDYHPLAVWLLSLTLFTAGAIVHELWTTTGFCVVTGTLATCLAVRGARR